MQVGGRRQDRILRGWERVLRGPWIFCIWRWVMRAVNKRASGRVQKEESRDAGRSFATEATRAEVRRLQKQNHVFCFSRAAAGTGSAAVSPRRILDLVPVQFALEHHRRLRDKDLVLRLVVEVVLGDDGLAAADLASV